MTGTLHTLRQSETRRKGNTAESGKDRRKRGKKRGGGWKDSKSSLGFQKGLDVHYSIHPSFIYSPPTVSMATTNGTLDTVNVKGVWNCSVHPWAALRHHSELRGKIPKFKTDKTKKKKPRHLSVPNWPAPALRNPSEDEIIHGLGCVEQIWTQSDEVLIKDQWR